MFRKLIVKNIKAIVFLSLLLSIALSCIDFSKKKAVKKDHNYEGPILEVLKVKTLLSESGVIKLGIFGDKSLQYKNGDILYPEGICIKKYKGDTQIISTLQADTLYYYSQQDLYKAIGNVAVKNYQKKEQLHTEELYWNPSKKEISTKKFVKIETKDEILMGEGLTANQDFTRYRIIKPTGVLRNIKQIN